MSTEEQRQRNREKQKRWRDSHRDVLRQRYWRKKALAFKVDLRPWRADFRTFELADPRDVPDLLPRLIGYCRFAQRPVWDALWALRNVSNAPWAAWFRDLEAAGLEPVERRGWAVGRVQPLNLWLVRSLVAMRLRQIWDATMDDADGRSEWFYNELWVGGKGKCRRVGRLLPDGSVERFASLREAGRAVGMSTDWIDHLASSGSVDSGGSAWFND